MVLRDCYFKRQNSSENVPNLLIWHSGTIQGQGSLIQFKFSRESGTIIYHLHIYITLLINLR